MTGCPVSGKSAQIHEDGGYLIQFQPAFCILLCSSWIRMKTAMEKAVARKVSCQWWLRRCTICTSRWALQCSLVARWPEGVFQNPVTRQHTEEGLLPQPEVNWPERLHVETLPLSLNLMLLRLKTVTSPSESICHNCVSSTRFFAALCLFPHL